MSINQNSTNQNTRKGDFLGNQVLNWTPIPFTVEFIYRMRKNQKKLQYIPSTRQAVAIPKLITAIYYRKNNLIPEDFIKAAVLTTPIEDQKLARKIAFEILFPKPFSPGTTSHNQNASLNQQSPQNSLQNSPQNQKDFMDDLLADLSDVGVDLNSLDGSNLADQSLKDFEEIMKFIEDLYSRAMNHENIYESIVDIVDQRDGFNDLLNKAIKNLSMASSYVHQIIQREMNSLSPQDIAGSKELGWIKEIQQQTSVPWIKTGALFSDNHPDYSKSLSDILNQKDIETSTKTIQFLKDLGEDPVKIQSLTQNIVNDANNLTQIADIAKILNSIPNFDQNKIFRDSLQQSLNQSFETSRRLDQQFNQSITEDLYDFWAKNHPDPSLSDMFQSQTSNPQWQKTWEEALKNNLNQISQSTSSKTLQFENLAQTLMQYASQAKFDTCHQSFENAAQAAGMQCLQNISDPPRFINSLQRLIDYGAPIQQDEVIKLGLQKGIPSDLLEEIFGGSFELLMNMIQGKKGSFQRYSHVLQNISNLSGQQLKDLIAQAYNNSNINALAALGHSNLNQALKMAKQIGDPCLQQLTASLGAGPGDDLLLQWFLHRHNIPKEVKHIIRNLTKEALVKIALDLLSKQRGSGEKGLIPTNQLRVYLDGDDMDLIDIDASIENIIMQGKSLEMLRTDDLLVADTQQGRVSICFLLDISGSMSGEKLAGCSIATLVLIGKLKTEEVAIALFESNTHVLKAMDEKKELDIIADELLDLRARGGTQVGQALKWANSQLEDSDSEKKICFLLTDCMFAERNIKKLLEPLVDNKVQFILGVNTRSYTKRVSNMILEQTQGELVEILDIKEIPKVLTEVLEKIN